MNKKDGFGVQNGPDSGTFLIDVPVGDNTDQLRYSRCTLMNRSGEKQENCINPQEACSVVKVLEHGTYKSRTASKVLLQAVTGRRHQLRVHLQYIGHPVVGDMCYGIEDFDTYRTMLHAYKFKMRVDTRNRMFIKATAGDPFTTLVDPDWLPKRTFHELEKLKI